MKMWNGYCVPEGEIGHSVCNGMHDCYVKDSECTGLICEACVGAGRNGVVEQYLKEQEMKIPELESGMYVKSIYGYYYLYCSGRFYMAGAKNTGVVVTVAQDDIIEVYNIIPNGLHVADSYLSVARPIWKRPEDNKKLRELEDKAIAARKAVEEVEAEIKALRGKQ